MKIVEQSHEILSISPQNILKHIEEVARTCYQSHNKTKIGSDITMVQNLINRGHEAALEFGDITIKFITNRGISHELVRHRLCSFMQESTRYVKYNGNMEFIRPIWYKKDINSIALNYTFEECITFTPQAIWKTHITLSEKHYKNLLDLGWKPQQAREILPNSLKTEIIMKGNLREWRHIFSLRCDKTAHPQMIALLKPLLQELHKRIPIVFDDLYIKFIKNKKEINEKTNK